MIIILKSITAKQLFKRYPEIKAKLWGGKFRTSGFYANTVGQYSKEEVIKAYVKNQEGHSEVRLIFEKIKIECRPDSMIWAVFLIGKEGVPNILAKEGRGHVKD